MKNKSHKNAINRIDWTSFLKGESEKAIEQYNKNKQEYEKRWSGDWWFSLPSEALESGWLGLPEASEEQIVAAETRLGVTLPPSYRNFLKVTNGWLYYPDILRLRSTQEIEWFSVENQDCIDVWLDCHQQVSDEKYLNYEQNWWFWNQTMRTKYMQNCLQISDNEDGDVVLLNPKVMHNDEWEAWIFSPNHAGINRCRSFKEMLYKIGLVGPWI